MPGFLLVRKATAFASTPARFSSARPAAICAFNEYHRINPGKSAQGFGCSRDHAAAAAARQTAGHNDGDPELGREILQRRKRTAKAMDRLFYILTQVGREVVNHRDAHLVCTRDFALQPIQIAVRNRESATRTCHARARSYGLGQNRTQRPHRQPPSGRGWRR